MHPQIEFESEAYPDNVLRIDILQDGTSVLSVYDSTHKQTALSYRNCNGKAAHA